MRVWFQIETSSVPIWNSASTTKLVRVPVAGERVTVYSYRLPPIDVGSALIIPHSATLYERRWEELVAIHDRCSYVRRQSEVSNWFDSTQILGWWPCTSCRFLPHSAGTEDALDPLLTMTAPSRVDHLAAGTWQRGGY